MKQNVLSIAKGNAAVQLEAVDGEIRIKQQERVEELAGSLNEQRETITEYSKVLVRRMIEKIIVYDEKLTIEFKSGLKIDVEM